MCVECETVSEQYHEGKLTASVVLCVCVELCGIVFVWNVSVCFPSACVCAFMCVWCGLSWDARRALMLWFVCAVCVVAACGRRAIGIVDHDLSRCVNSYPP